MILEAIVTTVDRQGRVNIAPMGPQWNPSLQRATQSQTVRTTDYPNPSAESTESIPRDADQSKQNRDSQSPPNGEDPEGSFLLKPFKTSRTYTNLIHQPSATIHITDDALLFARAAVGKIAEDEKKSLVQPIEGTHWWTLLDCHRWFAVETTVTQEDSLRASMACCVRHRAVVRPFYGFNRAKHAVIEAAILATRTHLLSQEQVHSEISRLEPLVEKTGGPDEHLAFEILKVTIDERYATIG